MLDLRFPSGLFFAVVGVILTGLGLFADARPQMSNANVNLYAGFAMVAFGSFLLLLAYRHAHRNRARNAAGLPGEARHD